MTAETGLTFGQQLRIQGRVIWALTMREVITRFGREGIGAFWLLAEPAMFIVGVMIIFSYTDSLGAYSVAEYLAVSYPTLLLWRNGSGRVIKAIDVNRALLHHQPIRPIDIIYSRILLEFSGSTGAFIILFIIFVQLGICHWPRDLLTMCIGYLLIVGFSFAFVMIMAALTELSDTFERISHIITYLMLPFTGVFFPVFLAPSQYRELLLDMPLVDAVEYFHRGYYGYEMPTFYHLEYTVFFIIGMILFGYLLTNISIKKIQLN